MAHPNNAQSTVPYIAPFIDPDGRDRGLLEDYELGGVGVSDASLGLQFQVWHLTYDDDKKSATYGDFTLTPEKTLTPVTSINVAEVVNCGFCFDQSMRPAICYELDNGNSYFYWYDSFLAQFVTTQLPAGSFSPRMCLDDHRETQSGTSDMILAYLRAGTVYFRMQRDRFDTEYIWDTGVGGGPLYTLGMTTNNRVRYEVGSDKGVALCNIVSDLCEIVDVTKYDVSELCRPLVRGFLVAGMYSSADTIRSLQKIYFFDMPEIDGKLRGILRGQDNEATILLSDMVEGQEVDLETAREQAVEFPRKVHLTYASAESDYTPTKQTSERRSPDIRSQTEITIESAVNHTADDAAQRANIIHTMLWNEMEGYAKFSLDESWWRLCPSNPINLEIRPDQYKRLRIIRSKFTEGTFEIEALVDRKSTYKSEVVGQENIAPTSPQPSLPGDTTWHFMDLPALLTTHDTLIYYAAARGDVDTAWHGAQIQRSVGSDWQKERDITYAEKMGVAAEAVGSAQGYYIDEVNTILLTMETPNKVPESVTDDDMFSGRGAWVIDNEIIQVRDWVAEGNNWRGSYLFRGRLNTAVASHSIGARIIYLGNPSAVPVDVSRLDTDLTLRAVSFGGSTGTSGNYTFTGKSQEEWPPEMLSWSKNGNDWIFNWIPRYPLGNSANPIPHSKFYGWILRFTVGSNTFARIIEDTDPTFTYTSAMQVEDFGSNQTSFDSVEVRGLNYLGGEGQALTEASVS